MRTIVLDGNEVQSVEKFHDIFSRRAQLPDYYGHNLDAFWDCITTDVEGALEIIWKNHEISQKALGNTFEKIKELLEEACEERGDLSVRYE